MPKPDSFDPKYYSSSQSACVGDNAQKPQATLFGGRTLLFIQVFGLHPAILFIVCLIFAPSTLAEGAGVKNWRVSSSTTTTTVTATVL